ncbi:YceG family protein [Ostertagia ostertagi]
MGGSIYVGHVILTAQGPLDKTKNVVIPRGAGPTTMAKLLEEEGVIAHPRLFRVALMIDPSPKPIKAGEYEVPAHTSMQALVELLQSGKVVQRRLTIPEGTTTPEVLELVRKTEALTGDITLDVKEGDLLPETYFYSRDDTRDGLLLRMKEAMEKTLDEAWRKRAAGLPLANKREALILASMIEKETAVPAERTKVAAVFINRPAPAHEARERSDHDLRPHRREDVARARPDARGPAVEHPLQHLCDRRLAARAHLQSRTCLRSSRRPIRRATVRSSSSPTGRVGTPSPPRSPSTTATSSAGVRSSARRRNRNRRHSRKRRRPRRRRPGNSSCRRFSWRCCPSLQSP